MGVSWRLLASGLGVLLSWGLLVDGRETLLSLGFLGGDRGSGPLLSMGFLDGRGGRLLSWDSLDGGGVTSKAWWLGSMRLLWKVASSCRGGFLLGRWYKNGIGAGFIPVNKKCLRPLAGSFCQQTHVDVAEHEVKSRYINGTLDEKHE